MESYGQPELSQPRADRKAARRSGTSRTRGAPAARREQRAAVDHAASQRNRPAGICEMNGAPPMKGITMRNSWMIAACLAALLPAWGQNSQPPTARRTAFAGTWRLDLKNSSMGSDHPDANYGFTKTFELKGSTLVQKDHEVNVDIVGFALPERNSSGELGP